MINIAYFKELNENINTILTMIFENQLLCKYLYYGGEVPDTQEDISDTHILLMNNVFPLPLNPDANTNQKAILNVYFPKSKPYKDNSGFRQVILCFDVIAHLDIWVLDNNEILPYSIMNQLDSMFNNQYVSGLSVNKIFWEDDSMIKYSDLYYGYRLTYRLSNNSNITK